MGRRAWTDDGGPCACRRPINSRALQQWAVATAARRGNPKATITIENKLARIVWVVWRRDETFHTQPRLTAAAQDAHSNPARCALRKTHME